MNVNLRKTAIAIAAAALVASPMAFAQHNPDASADIDHQHRVNEDWDINVQEIRNNETTVIDNRDYDVTVDDIRNFEANVANRNYNENINVNADVNATVDADVDLVLDAAALVRFNGEYNEVTNDRSDTWTTSESHEYSSNSTSFASNVIEEDIDVDSQIRREQNEHGRAVYLSKNLSVNSAINITGDPNFDDLDSAAIAVVDGRQTLTGNAGTNDVLDNTAGLGDDAAAGASGNLGFNVAAGDNNAQDNAAALSAADASFAFGMADAEIFNTQNGFANTTTNAGVTNAAGIGGNAFNGASGNINVNVASGNNNAQRNSLASSVAVAGLAQASVASDQVSANNVVTNAGSMQMVEGSFDISLGGSVAGTDESSASYSGLGAAYQMGNIYPESWGADSNDGNHNSSPRLGHIDMDGDMQGSIDNPYRGADEFGEIGGIAFDTDENGTIDLSDTELAASLTGTADLSFQQMVAATNTAMVSGTAFSGAAGNIGVNIASGTGNLQSNSLSLAVAQPSTGGTTPVDPGPGG